jgi:hypothetical protein
LQTFEILLQALKNVDSSAFRLQANQREDKKGFVHDDKYL